jgi:predicted DNA-binding ribbon-helix-helix protein
MVRTQIQLEEAQYRALKELAMARSVSMAELMRAGVDSILQREVRARRWSALWDAVGSCREEDGDGSGSVRHDEHLTEIYRG